MKFERTLSRSVEYLESFGRLYFTPKQLYYEFCQISGYPFAYDLRKYHAVLSKFSNLIRPGGAPKPPITFEAFDERLRDHLRENSIDGLLQTEKEISFCDEFPPDLARYGLPKMLICEDHQMARMLRANQFHLQAPCAVSSLKETLPLLETSRAMLSRAEDPQVLFLHDASLPAFAKIRTLRQTIQLDDRISLRPVGLRPVHAMRLNLFVTRASRQDFDFSEFGYLNDEEKMWLASGNTAEVSAVSPVRLLRVLRRIILGSEISADNRRMRFPKKELGFM